ncbi:MAG: NAD(P)H-dependent oxidoreductase [Bacteroidales bacterium]|nr:NAD(P)H-dependent oxidoreductase [Bacteroidales bacterium]
MKTLVIIASHNSTSFNNAIKKRAVEKLKNDGHDIVVRDLYEMNFNPVLTKNDFEKLHGNNLPEEIVREQEYIKWAEKIIVIYPIWWTGMPAILKGYFDRVMLYGFAYKFDNTGLVKLLKGKEALIFSTSGQPKEHYEAIGMYDAMNKTTDLGIFDFVGINVKKHIYFPSIISANDSTRNEYLNTVEQELN